MICKNQRIQEERSSNTKSSTKPVQFYRRGLNGCQKIVSLQQLYYEGLPKAEKGMELQIQ